MWSIWVQPRIFLKKKITLTSLIRSLAQQSPVFVILSRGMAQLLEESTSSHGKKVVSLYGPAIELRGQMLPKLEQPIAAQLTLSKPTDLFVWA